MWQKLSNYGSGLQELLCCMAFDRLEVHRYKLLLHDCFGLPCSSLLWVKFRFRCLLSYISMWRFQLEKRVFFGWDDSKAGTLHSVLTSTVEEIGILGTNITTCSFASNVTRFVFVLIPDPIRVWIVAVVWWKSVRKERNRYLNAL